MAIAGYFPVRKYYKTMIGEISFTVAVFQLIKPLFRFRVWTLWSCFILPWIFHKKSQSFSGKQPVFCREILMESSPSNPKWGFAKPY